MYQFYFLKIRKVNVHKAYDILSNRRKLGDIDRWCFRRWDEDAVLCVFSLIVSDDYETIKNEFKLAGIQIL